MLCQLSTGCQNVGVYSCEGCGHLLCGAHVDFNTSSGQPYCADCRHRNEVFAEAKEAQFRRWLPVRSLGGALIVLGIFLAIKSPIPGVLDALIIGGIIVALIGYYDRDLPS